MNFAQKIDFDILMEPVALRLLGEPQYKRGDEWRYGSRRSLSIDIVTPIQNFCAAPMLLCFQIITPKAASMASR